MDYDVLVVGGGPAGCATARDIAAAGFKVLVAEEHSAVGEPLQCSGLISPRALELSRVSNQVVLNELKGTLVYASIIEFSIWSGRIYGLAIDRWLLIGSWLFRQQKPVQKLKNSRVIRRPVFREGLRPEFKKVFSFYRAGCFLQVGDRC